MKNRIVYIIEAKRSAIGKAKKGAFASFRPDELLAHVIQNTVQSSRIDVNDIDDVIIGCAFPEAQQGLNVARISLLLANLPNHIPGITVNRYCSSGLNAVAMGANAISQGQCEVVLCGGIESMSLIPMGGNDLSISPLVFKSNEHISIAYGMGITAEIVANKWNITRSSQDEFALRSHQLAMEAINKGHFKDEIVPVIVNQNIPNESDFSIKCISKIMEIDEGPRADTSIAALSKLMPSFANNGSVTAGNSSQMSDGASCLLLVSEDYLKKHNLKPMAKFLGFSVAGVEPAIMGIGPVKAVPKVLLQLGLNINDIDLIELNEAFAAQSLAVIHDLKLDINKVNITGGAIALGHPLGATGAILTTKLLYNLRRLDKKIGMVTMCIGTGMGAAGIFEIC